MCIRDRTRGRIVRENSIFEAGSSYLTVKIETSKPIRRLVRTTAKNKVKVLNKREKTSHDFRKADIFLEKLANRQNI